MMTLFIFVSLFFLIIIGLFSFYLRKIDKNKSKLKKKLLKCRDGDHDFFEIEEVGHNSENYSETITRNKCRVCHCEQEIVISITTGAPKRYLQVV